MYSIEPLKDQVLLIRFGDAHNVYGDPYESSAVIEISEGIATIKGLTKMPPKSWIQALFAELKQTYNLSGITWERYKENGVKRVVKS